MPKSNDYRFVSDWQVSGKIEDVFRILQDVERLPIWWPSVYLTVKELDKGHSGGIGRKIDLHTRGWLPYTLKWQMTIEEVEYPHHIALTAEGDLQGKGVWHLKQVGEHVHLRYDWHVQANKGLIKKLSPILKPVFAMNHRWAMKQGETSLKLELQRLQAKSMSEALQIAEPPGPESTAKTVAIMGGSLALLGALVWLASRKGKHRSDDIA